MWKCDQVLCEITAEIREIVIIIPITNRTYCRTMADKNNVEFAPQSTESTRIPHNDSTKSIVSSENRKPRCSAQRIFISAMDAINHALIIAVTVYLVYYSAKKYNVTNVHVILCTIGVSIPLSWNTRLIFLLLRRLF